MEKSISWLEKLLSLQGIQTSVSGNQTTGDLGDDSYWLTIDHEPLSDTEIDGLIGERGEVLDSIQYLANTILNMDVEESQQQSYTIEIKDYRSKRQAELKALADDAASDILKSGEAEHEIKGLSSAERRQVHGLLGEYEQLKTFSRGREPERHLVVQLATAEDDDSAGTQSDDDE